MQRVGVGQRLGLRLGQRGAPQLLCGGFVRALLFAPVCDAQLFVLAALQQFLHRCQAHFQRQQHAALACQRGLSGSHLRQLLAQGLLQAVHESLVAAQRVNRRAAAVVQRVAQAVFLAVLLQLLGLLALLTRGQFGTLHGGQAGIALALGVVQQGVQGS